MLAENILSESLKPGMKVRVNPQTDKTRKLLIEGVILEILTKSPAHPHGILVSLTSGERGRVKEILSHNTPKDTFSSKEQMENITEIIKNGEDHFSEFKSSALWSSKLSNEDIKKSKSPEVKQFGRSASKVILAKTLAGFLNTDGGHLVVGVKENKGGGEDEMIGVESEYFKLNDKCDDGYRRMLVDSVFKPYFPSEIFNHINDYMKITFKKVSSKTLCVIKVNKSDIKVFLTLNNVEKFFIRVDASTRQITGAEIVDFCERRFSKT